MNHLELLQAEILAKGGKSAMLSRALELGLDPALVHIDAALEGLLVKYENRNLIADKVLPIVRTKRRSNVYRRIRPETMFQVPQAAMSGTEAVPNRVNYGLDTNGSFSVLDYGLMDFISSDEESNADLPIEPRMLAEDTIMGQLMLAREARAAALVFGAANYGANTQALSGASRFDNAASDPIPLLLQQLRVPLVRPNVMVIGEDAWDPLRTNANVIKYVVSRGATKLGATPLMVDEETLAAALRLDKVLVGTAIVNLPREGATPSYTRIWGKSCALIAVQETPNPRATQTFGYTFRFTGDQPEMAVQSWYDQVPGTRGGTWIKVTHSDAEVVVGGATAGYLLTTVVS